MFARFPLLDPEIFLKRIMPLIKLLVSPFGAIVWLAVVLAAGKVVVDHFDAAFDQLQGVLAPENLFLLYLGLVVIKTLHEFGHALVCKRYGGEVHTMGVMLLVFTPLPYMDATSSWSFKSRWQLAPGRRIPGSACRERLARRGRSLDQLRYILQEVAFSSRLPSSAKWSLFESRIALGDVLGNLILYRPEAEESLTFQVESSRLLPKTARHRDGG
jgi:hypothetical protein